MYINISLTSNGLIGTSSRNCSHVDDVKGRSVLFLMLLTMDSTVVFPPLYERFRFVNILCSTIMLDWTSSWGPIYLRRRTVTVTM